jgi:hypothetical protein
MAKKFPKSHKRDAHSVQETYSTPNRHDCNSTSPWYIIIKTISTKNKKRILKAIGEKNQLTYKGKPIKIK